VVQIGFMLTQNNKMSSSEEDVEFSDENSDESPLGFFTKSTHFFLLLLASGRSSSKKGVTCSNVHLASSFWLLQPAAMQIVGNKFFFPHN